MINHPSSFFSNKKVKAVTNFTLVKVLIPKYPREKKMQTLSCYQFKKIIK